MYWPRIASVTVTTHAVPAVRAAVGACAGRVPMWRVRTIGARHRLSGWRRRRAVILAAMTFEGGLRELARAGARRRVGRA